MFTLFETFYHEIAWINYRINFLYALLHRLVSVAELVFMAGFQLLQRIIAFKNIPCFAHCYVIFCSYGFLYEWVESVMSVLRIYHLHGT